MARPAFPKSDHDKAKVYLHCMVEIKERLGVVEKFRQIPMQALFVNEACYLQLRYICELVAIGCLVAQGDYETQRTFREEHSPPKIFAALKRLHPHFFPQPMTITSSPGSHHFEANNKPDAYTEDQVANLWATSGDHLHRASITSYIKKTFAPPPDLASIDKHINGLVRLLECHLIPVWKGDQRRMLQVNLEDGTGNVDANWMDFDDTGGMKISTFRSAIVR
jgi:hypothetical protein